jgi:hypothetical protein
MNSYGCLEQEALSEETGSCCKTRSRIDILSSSYDYYPPVMITHPRLASRHSCPQGDVLRPCSGFIYEGPAETSGGMDPRPRRESTTDTRGVKETNSMLFIIDNTSLAFSLIEGVTGVNHITMYLTYMVVGIFGFSLPRARWVLHHTV